MEFLGRAATYGGASVKRIDTHAASVFLAGERALKIKRAVRFPFLDFSTLEKRKAACEAELEVNRPYAPAIYRSVVAITRGPQGLQIGGTGEPVEWAVEMRRFDETQTLDHLAERGEIDKRLADALGRAVAKAHAAAPVGSGFVEELGGGHRAKRRRVARDARVISDAASGRADRGHARGVYTRAAVA